VRKEERKNKLQDENIMSKSPTRGGHNKCHILTEIIVCIVLQLKMPLGKEVGLGSGHIVLDGDTAPPRRGTAALPPMFGPCLFCPDG